MLELISNHIIDVLQTESVDLIDGGFLGVKRAKDEKTIRNYVNLYDWSREPAVNEEIPGVYLGTINQELESRNDGPIINNNLAALDYIDTPIVVVCKDQKREVARSQRNK